MCRRGLIAGFTLFFLTLFLAALRGTAALPALGLLDRGNLGQHLSGNDRTEAHLGAVRERARTEILAFAQELALGNPATRRQRLRAMARRLEEPSALVARGGTAVNGSLAEMQQLFTAAKIVGRSRRAIGASENLYRTHGGVNSVDSCLRF